MEIGPSVLGPWTLYSGSLNSIPINVGQFIRITPTAIDINFTGTQLSCSFDIAKTSEPGKFKIDWEIYKERITINELSYTLTEEEKDQTTKEKIATYFAKNIPKGFEGMVAFFSPFFLKNEKYKDKLVFQPSITEINFDDIKLFYVYINNMDQGVKNKEYLKT